MCEWKSTDGSLEMKLFVGFWSGENNRFKPISIITNKSRCKSKSKIEITAFDHYSPVRTPSWGKIEFYI